MRSCCSELEVFERAHVVQAVGKLDHHDANVVDHGQEHFADVFGLARFRREQVEAADLGDAFDEERDIGAELLGDAVGAGFGVLNDVVEKRGAERCHVELHIREDVRHFQRVRKVGLAGKAHLRFVLFGGEIVGAAEELEVVAGAAAADFVHQLDEAQVHGAARREADGRFGHGFHGRFHCNAEGARLLTDISVPAELGSLVKGVVSLHDFFSKPPLTADSPFNNEGYLQRRNERQPFLRPVLYHVVIGAGKLLIRRVESKNCDVWIFRLEPINHFFSRLFGRCMAHDKEREVGMPHRTKKNFCRFVANHGDYSITKASQ